MIGRAYRIAQILSIDIVIGAVILLRFFCVQFGVKPGWEVYALLGGTVWLIYTADHLRDATSQIESNRERYLFHKKHRKLLIVLASVMLCLMTVLLFFIPVVILKGGVALASLSFIYLLVQYRLSRYLSKEFYVALIYSLGILMVPMVLSEMYDWSVFLLLFLLTFINLILFSWFEKNEDSVDGFLSIATELSEKKLEKLILILLSIGIAISLLLLNLMAFYFFLGFFTYGLMAIYPTWFNTNQRYRSIGDGVFLVPILFEWL
ncbi:hypothetical protein [Ekhidna sp.]|uniref:hypothetical protein n=1 Tax=Ekhidna sp. TaxID=2608089 RepID=UPI0035185DF4